MEVTHVSASPVVGHGSARSYVPGGSVPVIDGIRQPGTVSGTFTSKGSGFHEYFLSVAVVLP